MTQVVGILQPQGNGGLVVPDRVDPQVGREVFISQRDLHGAPLGMKVVCEILALPTASRSARGRIIEVLGDPGRPDVAILGIIRQYGLPDRFPEPVLAAAASYGIDPDPEVIAAEIARGRRDLRPLRTLTIDGEDAKDLDDAISIETLPGGRFRLGIHIADVSHYVAENSVLDQEARRRGTSVYLVDRVLPMLPPRLSNGICSLNPDTDRLTLSVFLEIDATGLVEKGEICESIIHSQARTTYTEVRTALETGEVLDTRYPGFLADLRLMQQLARLLEARRKERGAIDFEFPQTHVELDADGRPTAIAAYPLSFANGIIESFMIAANEYVARQCASAQLPFLYRVHELPDPDKLKRFLSLAAELGVKIRIRGRPTPAVLAKALEQIRQEPFGLTLAELLLRSLAKARYDPRNLGHFGLASEFYCHFTSPIRRYPDLYIHRIIKASLHQQVARKRWQAEVETVALHSSDMERLAMQAERDSVDQKAAEYLSEHLGLAFPGLISGFNPAGFFVRLENTVEGMVPFRTLDGYYVYQEDRLCAVNQQTGRQLHLGDLVTVQVARVDTVGRRIDFALIDHQSRHQPAEGSPARPGRNERSSRSGSPAEPGRPARKARSGQPAASGPARKTTKPARSSRAGRKRN